MKLSEFLTIMENNPNSAARFHLPGGRMVERHFHVTEVGRVSKDFVDCGGTRRGRSSCQLQLWVANDEDHRMTAGKIHGIFGAARCLGLTEDMPVEVQYGAESAVVYDVSCVRAGENVVDVYLSGQRTDCLAPDKCGVSCCSGSRCC